MIPGTNLRVISKSALTGRFCISVILFYFLVACPGTAYAARCHPREYHEIRKVIEVIDGDTVILEDNRHIRLIGINTPEIDHENNTAETGALEARDYLARILGIHPEVYLYIDTEKYDRYQRTLAHIFLPDGSNIQQLILEQGLATPLTIPPNLAFVECYQQASHIAMEDKRGLWADPAYAMIEPDNIKPAHINKYIAVTGIITGITRFDSATEIRLAHNVDLVINKSTYRYFENIDLDNLVGRRVSARGWLKKRKNVYQIRISHPVELVIINEH